MQFLWPGDENLASLPLFQFGLLLNFLATLPFSSHSNKISSGPPTFNESVILFLLNTIIVGTNNPDDNSCVCANLALDIVPTFFNFIYFFTILADDFVLFCEINPAYTRLFNPLQQ